MKNGRLTLASGANYSLLLLPPGDPHMTPRALQCIANLVRDGLTVVGARPQFSPSLTDYPACDAQVKKLADALWGPCDGKTVLEHASGKGRIVWGRPVPDILASQKLALDFEFTGTSDATKLLYCHRVDGDTEIYFVSNQRGEADLVDVTFRICGRTPELWHADTGIIERAPVWHEQDGRTTVPLTFAPAGSAFVIFRQKASGDHLVAAQMDSQWQIAAGANGKMLVKANSEGTAEFHTAEGKTLQIVVANLPAPQTLSGDWTLRFPPNWGAPSSVTLDKLISWTEHPESGVCYFSGTATYEKEIEISTDRLSGGRELWLDLGKVKNIAEVSLNGQDLGVLWKPPFRVNITTTAKPGVNKLAVKVTNLWPNRLIGDEQLPPDCEWDGLKLKAWPQWLLDGKPSPTGRRTFTTWHHWTKNMKPLESGMLGPVVIRTVALNSIGEPKR